MPLEFFLALLFFLLDLRIRSNLNQRRVYLEVKYRYKKLQERVHIVSLQLRFRYNKIYCTSAMSHQLGLGNTG